MAERKRVLSARLEPEYIAALDEVAKMQRITRSQLLRQFAENAALLYNFLKAERDKEQTEMITVSGEFSRWILEHSPPQMTPELMHFLGVVMHQAARMKESEETGEQSS